MRKVCVVTGSRADYGLLRWVIEGIQDSSELELQLVATGMHLSPEFGLTWREIVLEAIYEWANRRNKGRIEALLQVLRFVAAESRLMKHAGTRADGFPNGFQNAPAEGRQMLYLSHLYFARFAGSANQSTVSASPRLKPSCPP